MHQISIKSMKLPEPSKITPETIIEKIMIEKSKQTSKEQKTPTTPRLQTGTLNSNEINDPNSEFFEAPETPTRPTRIFSENSVQILASKTFNQSIEKIDFVSKQIDFAVNRTINFAIKSKQTTQKRKANQSSIWSRKIEISIKIITNLKDALENSAKCINYALNLANANQKVSIRKILKELNQCKNFMNLNSNEIQIENTDQKMQNADETQSAQNT